MRKPQTRSNKKKKVSGRRKRNALPQEAPMSSPVTNPLPVDSPSRAAAEEWAADWDDGSEPCPDEGPTLLGPSGTGDTGTSQGTVEHPTEWISWRFTTPYQQRIQDIFDRGLTYIASFEKSVKGVEHWHVLSVGHEHYERTKKYIQRKLNLQGMKWWSKKNSGTFEGALAYTMKCLDNSISGSRSIQSADWPAYVYKKWTFSEQQTIKLTEMKEADVKKLRSWQLTYSNIVDQALHYHRTNSLSVTVGLRETVRQLMEHTKWRPSPQMLREGINEFYEQDFEFRKGQVKKLDMSWFTPRMR